ncbi:MAG: hypothetical protein HKN51_15835, partial [Saprospiraceae bacterium]|nr:hypothetical protein [Saprospiraceae bacterium]
MKLFFISSLVACALLLNAQVENGCISIDFESFPNQTPTAGLVLSDQYKDAFGLSFSLETGGFPVLADVGGAAAEAFGSAWGNDTPRPSVDIGKFFLTDDGQLSGLTSPAIILDFEVPIDSFAGCILDMDFEEFFIIQALDEFGTVILEERIDAGDPGTGDGQLTCWGFNLPGCEGSIYSIKYAGFRPETSPGAFGLGMDYFSFCYSGLQIDTETTPVTCDELGSINIFSTTDELYEYSLDGSNYSLNGSFDQLDEGVQTIYVKDSEDCTTTVDVNVEMDIENLPDPIFIEEVICEGQVFSFNGQEYNSTGMYQQTLEAANGCDTLWNLSLTVNPNLSEIINLEICDGETIDINGESYSTSGSFEQVLNSLDGCDSTLVINVENIANTMENVFAQICEGESYVLNGESYISEGLYSQPLTNQGGCDSLLILELEVLEITEGSVKAEICDGTSYELNGENYTDSGTYTQSLTNIAGCDSIITLDLAILSISTGSISQDICEGEDVIINGEIYNTPGTYSQVLVNTAGCDSLLDVTINFLPLIETCIEYTIFGGEFYALSGNLYGIEGIYEHVFQSSDGCDSLVILKLTVLPEPLTIVHYDLDDCTAGGSSYNELIPEYEDELSCADIYASILNRPSNRTHSCTPGADGSGMCISSELSCQYQEDSEHRLIFDVVIDPTSGPVAIGALRFFEKAPEYYEYNVGNSGINNYPTFYSLKITHNDDVIYFDEAISTNREWTLQSFIFADLDQFVFDELALLQVEFLAYCPIGIDSRVSAWDIDEVSLLGFCQPENNIIEGSVMTMKKEPLSDVMVAVNRGEFWDDYTSDYKGEFVLETPYDQKSVLIEPMKDNDYLNGVSSLDLILIQRHILGIQKFDDFSNLVAADINKDNKIDAVDLIQLKKLLLGIYISFPENTSWRFLEEDYNYNHLSEVKDRMIINTLNKKINLEGIKVGDVNQSYIAMTHHATEEDDNNKSNFILKTKEIQNYNEDVSLGFYAAENFSLSGIQATFNIGNYTDLNIVPHILNIENHNYHIINDKLKVTWTSQYQEVQKGDLLFEIVNNEGQELSEITLDADAQNEIYQTSDLSVHPL